MSQNLEISSAAGDRVAGVPEECKSDGCVELRGKIAEAALRDLHNNEKTFTKVICPAAKFFCAATLETRPVLPRAAIENFQR